MPSVHPSSAYAFDDLVREMQARVAAGLVRETRAPDANHLTLYCYTQSAVVDRAWDGVVDMARGLVVDFKHRVVRSRPFPKFFNYGERGLLFPDGPYNTYEKMDGSMIPFFHDGDRWRCTTKGSFTSTQSQWAQAWLESKDVSGLTRGDTYVFEAIYTSNRIVVKYDFEGLVLLTAYAADGREYTRDEVVRAAKSIGTRAVDVHSYESIDAMQAALTAFKSDREGFVVHFPETGYRVKLKGAEYLRIHRLISRVTPLAIWDVMQAGDDVDAIRRDIPEEFWTDFDQIRSLLTSQLESILAAVEIEHTKREHATNKEIGLALKSIPSPASSFIFARRKGGKWMEDPKTRRSLYGCFRPTSNILPGYSRTEAVERLDDE